MTTWGNGFLVNTIAVGNQSTPAVTALADGRFVVMWTDVSGTLGDNQLSAVHGQIFNAHGGKMGSEFLVNTLTAGDQTLPAVTALADGRFVATWGDGSAGNFNIRAQVFNLDGSKRGSEFVANTTTALEQTAPEITLLADGRYVMTWQDTSSGNFDIRAQIFNAGGTKWASEFVVAGGASHQMQPSIETLSDGRFVVAWRGEPGADGSGSAVRVQIYNDQGSEWGFPFTANTTVLNNQSMPRITALADGRFVIAWMDESQSSDDASSYAVRAQVFNFDGSKSGAEFLVNTRTNAGQGWPAITSLNDGRFAVTFSDGSMSADDPSGLAVRTQIFDANGTKSGPEFLTNIGTTAGAQYEPAIATLVDGRFVVVYTDESASGGDTSGLAVRAQIFDPRTGAVQLTGQGLNDQFVGTTFNDTLVGGSGDDELDGWLGNDTLEGGAGADSLDGHGGFDFASYQSSDAGVTINLIDGIAFGGHAEGDIIADVFNVIGSAFDDVLIGDFENNTLDGGGRNDVLDGGNGFDTLIGGTGDDTFVVDSLGDTIVENLNEGTDTVRTALATYELIALPQVENLTGLAGTGQTLVGNARDNVIMARGGNDTLIAGGGKDTLKGGFGNDTIDGGIGDDTAVFIRSIDQYTLHDLGDRILVTGGEGTDTLYGIEHLQFADGTLDVTDDGNGLFDSLYYLSRNADVFHAGMNPLTHFNIFGWQEGRDPNAFFDTSGYLAVNKDVAASGINPLDHYRLSGWHEGRDPSASFDTRLYLTNNPDVAALGINPLEHFLLTGRAEGRQAHAAVGPVMNGFDAQYYLFHNPDVAAAGVDPLFHYYVVGWKEGRDPNGWFDSSGYLAHYTDVAAAGINPLQHYEAVGWTEGRDASAWFDTAGYLAAYPDVAAANYNPLDHFLQNGIYEGRQAVNDGMWG